ncbi:hypothetical protein P3T76_007113 [Phytophthora citrophthora]|uniref:Uncharacterized protein n=1 Tax=Phytophthora citrophthora TaxID=4793 RepID=A0AAD9GMN0_9STRA|nr:hypothetical protein P3T76_007113 [Phytophthora citrophthora]
MENKTSATEGSICLYASKPCTNPRAVKRNGQLHQFCEFHRSKANFSQRRLDQKRQLEQELARLNQSTSQSQVSHVRRIESALADEIDLSDDEIQVLLEMVSAYRP